MAFVDRFVSLSYADRIVLGGLVITSLLFLVPVLTGYKDIVYPLRNLSSYERGELVIQNMNKANPGEVSDLYHGSGYLNNECFQVRNLSFSQKDYQQKQLWYNAELLPAECGRYPNRGLLFIDATGDRLTVADLSERILMYSVYLLIFPLGLMAYIFFRKKFPHKFCKQEDPANY